MDRFLDRLLQFFQGALLFALGAIFAVMIWGTAPTHHNHRPPDEWGLGDVKAAQDYADWCGGTVVLAARGPYVVNCDS